MFTDPQPETFKPRVSKREQQVRERQERERELKPRSHLGLAGWARVDWRQRTRLGLEVHIKPWNRLCETDL